MPTLQVGMSARIVDLLREHADVAIHWFK